MESIKIVIRGGLGNQLFQFFFGEYLKLVHKVNVFYAPDFEKDSYGRTLLFDKLFPSASSKIIAREDSKLLQPVDAEDPVHVDSLLSDHKRGSVTLRGYWQDLSYVLYLMQSGALTRSLEMVNACAIHVRRSDYAHLGQLRMSYYQDALEAIGSPSFFIFTDEPNFAHSHFCRYDGYLGILSSADPIADFIRFSTFGVKITSNSTYAVTSAILGHQDAKVIYPWPWGLGTSLHIGGVPSSWLKLPARYVEV